MENIERKIISNPSITDVQVLSSFVKSKNREAKNIDEIACCFIEVGKKYGVNGNIAFCQAILETGWFKFDKGTAVTPEQHNYCGLGVVSKGSKGCSFNTVEDGVTAMIQHLYAYADTKELPKGEILIDPRFKYVQRGVAKTWDDLSNRWAMNKDYGKHILNIYEELINYKPEGGTTVSKLIALSDGHGVDTAGKRTPVLPNGEKSETGKAYMNENLFNRAVVKYLDAELKRHGFKTLLVAPTDADTPLETRTKLANSKKADLYVSVHANASAGKWGSHGGIETFTWGSGESLRIGKLIHAELIKGSPLKDRGVKNGQHLWEVKQTNMPAVLVEAGLWILIMIINICYQILIEKNVQLKLPKVSVKHMELHTKKKIQKQLKKY